MSDDEPDPCDCDNSAGFTPPDGALVRELRIVNRKGLHARATAKFVRCADSFDAEILVGRCGDMVGGGSIMGILTLGAGLGSTILVAATGRQAQEAIEAITELVANRFGEDE
ncbi:phosphocarrier, HPr family [Methylocella silvestris BL2]|uniref:Phosphocarrier, HPr family n=1 Tax=Methylocella silvestris (strain DSM 15510 / CIP 108128 / LMG 27833 / NCIMB 13906 / BL2) TaxID=395965 RepID=B8ENZ3_METSB|nr:HPr family phosphocarrier protein [Methylocella silvestris]ACK49231.1 phosphocarrier, HPr family [Methylocella silvestris BL2]